MYWRRRACRTHIVLLMRSRRVHPEQGGRRDPESGSAAFFTDVKEAWSPESPERPPGQRSTSSASGGALVPGLPIDALDGTPARTESKRSASAVAFGSTPRLSERKRHAEEDVDDDGHRAPSCGSYYARSNRCEHAHFSTRATAEPPACVSARARDPVCLCHVLTAGRVPVVGCVCPGTMSRSSTRRSCSCSCTFVRSSR